MKKRIIVISTITAITAIIFAATFPGSAIKRHGSDDQAEPYHLNDNLTNAMSDIEGLEKMDRTIMAFLNRWQIKGASLAISRNDSLLYAKGYGWADQEKGIKMQPKHTMRMASVSKLVTAAGIMKLQEEGLLSIRDTVFGPAGILCDSTYTSWIRDHHIYSITVEHLLRHQAGFGRDPMFSSLDVMHQMGLDSTPDNEDFIELTLKRRVRFKPGEWQSYSNFGYMLLSKIIEKVSGLPYEEYIQTHVLHPAGCYDFHIAENYYASKQPDEVRYYTHEGDGKYVHEYTGSGKMVERSDGGNNIKGLMGAGAWCASPAEMCRLVCCMDKDPYIKDILNRESIDEMTEYFDSNTFSLGWNDTKPDGTWTRTGTLAGTSALVKHFPDGECWVMITNTSTWKGPGFTRYTARLFDQCRELYSDRLPARDLFKPEPTLIDHLESLPEIDSIKTDGKMIGKIE